MVNRTYFTKHIALFLAALLLFSIIFAVQGATTAKAVSETVKFYKGIDIGAKVGASILTADSGTVITAGNDPAGDGIYVVIYHSEGRSTLYAHMSSAAVTTGELVTQGQVIGHAGSSGMSTGPHLHFEVAIDGELQDPLDYFDIELPE